MSANHTKRRRMDLVTETESKQGNMVYQGTAIEQELRKMSMEIEPVVIRMKDKSSLMGYRPTYRATLAKQGYLLRHTLGTGSYSKVKLALNVCGVGGDQVAIKIVDRSKAPKDFQQRFLPRELKYWPLLNHPNLVKLFYCFEDSRKVYIILEYLNKGNALQYIQMHHHISENVARKWMYQIADAVRYMHDRDITHRDLKLENILLDGDCNIKICDFGFIKSESSKQLSQTYCGSKSYAAPEILQGHPYDPKKADVWAMAVILYIIVTGRMPFDETKGTKHILREQKNLVFNWSSSLNISEECRDLVLKMFVWDFQSRASVHDVLSHAWFVGSARPSDHYSVQCETSPNPRATHTTPSGSSRQTAPTLMHVMRGSSSESG